MKKLILAAMMLIPAITLANPGNYLQVEAGPNLAPLPGGAIGLNVGHLWGGNHFNYGVEAGITTGIGMGLFSNDSITDLVIGTAGVAKYTFDSGFLVLGKAGIAYVNQSDGALSISGFGPKAELGIGYQFNPKWEMDLTGEATFAKAFGVPVRNPDGSYNGTYSGGLFLGTTYHFA